MILEFFYLSMSYVTMKKKITETFMVRLRFFHICVKRNWDLLFFQLICCFFPLGFMKMGGKLLTGYRYKIQCHLKIYPVATYK